jgi:hypothetical protein
MASTSSCQLLLDININHLESKIEEVHQVRVRVHGPAECEEGVSWAIGVYQGGGGDDDVHVQLEDRGGGMDN